MLKVLSITALSMTLVTVSVTGFAMHMQEKNVTLQDQKQVGVTIYNENLALVRDQRQVAIDQGINKLTWREVSRQIRPQTVLLRAIGQPSETRLLEQSFDLELLTPEKLLESYLGRAVNIVFTNPVTGKETVETATVLSALGGGILKFTDRIEVGTPGRITFPDMPEHLHDRPTLSLLLESLSSGNRKLELSYLTSGLSWQADYTAELNATDSRINLSGLITLANHSGITYPDAHLQLVAGNINQVTFEQPQARKMMAIVADAAEYQTNKEESLFEYHLYTMPASATLAENQTKQVTLMTATDIPVSKEFLLRGTEAPYYSRYASDNSSKLRPDVFIQFENRGKELGKPLPGGTIRVYKNDSQGDIQFLGEDRVNHTAKNESVRVKLGQAFDIIATKTQTDFQQLDTPSQRFTETAHKIEIYNARQETVTIRVQEPIPGDWIVISESFPHTKPTSNFAEWHITIPSNETTTLSYRVRVKH